MNFPNVVAAIDAIRDLIPVAAGIERDDALTEPATIAPRRLYVWPRRIAARQGMTDTDLGEYLSDTSIEIRALFTLGAKGEPRVVRNDRDLSLELAAAAGAIVKALRANDTYPPGSGALWQDLAIVAILPDYARNDRARGWAVDFRILMPWTEDLSSSGDGS